MADEKKSFYESLIDEQQSSLNNENKPEEGLSQDPGGDNKPTEDPNKPLSVEDVDAELNKQLLLDNVNADPNKEDVVDEWFLNPDKVDQSAENKKPEEWEEKYKQVESKLKEVEEDELIALHLKYKNTEGYDFQKLVASFNKNKEERSVQDLYKAYLEKSGVDSDQIDMELAKLDSKTTLEIDDLKLKLEEKLGVAEVEDNPYIALLNKKKEDEELEMGQYNQKLDRAWKKADSFMESIVGRKIGSFELTKDIVENVKKSFSDPNYSFDEKGEIDSVKQMNERFWGLYGPEIVKSMINSKKEEFMQARSNPSANKGNSPVAPIINSKSKEEKDMDSFFRGDKSESK